MNKCTNKLVRKKLNIKAIMNNTPICENLLPNVLKVERLG